jgi:hypothetical protein
MAPPYKFIDEATGETVWSGMDAPPGDFIEVWAAATEGSPLHRISPGALQRPEDAAPPIEPPIEPPITPPSGANGMDTVTNERELKDALQTYANEMRVGQLYGKGAITVNDTINIRQWSHDGCPWGVNMNHTKIQWKGPGGKDVLVYQGVDGIGNRCLFLEKFVIDGNGYGGAPAGACLKLYAPDGDPGCIYKFTVRDVFTGYATNGIVLEGAVFEGLMENVHAENHREDGILCKHIYEPRWSIVSNIMILHPNSSRNFGAGMRQCYSVNSIFGSYVLNAQGGIVGPEGIRSVLASNGENTGEQLFNLGTNGYGSVVHGCEASTNGETVARAYEGGQWVDKGKPMLYGMNQPGGVYEEGSHVSYYGSGGHNVRWVK